MPQNLCDCKGTINFSIMQDFQQKNITTAFPPLHPPSLADRKRRLPLRLLRRDLIPTSALPRVLFIVPHGMWVCCSSAALCVSIASMSIARDVIPQQILGSCADCQSASLSFPKSAYSCLNLHKEAYFSSKTCVFQKLFVPLQRKMQLIVPFRDKKVAKT
jgi:hypothetical protein